MEHRQLLKRRQELHQKNLPTHRQSQRTEPPQIQNPGSTIAPSTTGQNHLAPVSNSDMYAWQRTDPVIDSRYDAGCADSSHLGFFDRLSNRQEESFNLGAPEQSGIFDAELWSSGAPQVLNSMPAPSAYLAHNRYYETQEVIPAFLLDQTSMPPLSIVPQHGQNLHPTPLVSSSRHRQSELPHSLHARLDASSVPHDQQPTHNLDKRVIPVKRSRSRQPAVTPGLPNDQRQLAKRIGAPENMFGVSHFNPVRSNKRSRTLFQKQNKKDVLDAGGSCFLCAYDNKLVRFSPFSDLFRTDSSDSALVFHVRLVKNTGSTNQ